MLQTHCFIFDIKHKNPMQRAAGGNARSRTPHNTPRRVALALDERLLWLGSTP
jgi:hypothetical protein